MKERAAGDGNGRVTKAAVAAFDPHLVTDAKRLVRGEHYLLAKRIAASRSADRAFPSVLMVPGRAAHEEVSAIRACMPRARITAVDRDTAALETAIAAGVDDVIEADLSDIKCGNFASPDFRGRKFDVVNMDLCGGATETFRKILGAASRRVSTHGVLIAWFSYGRDVTEAYLQRVRGHLLAPSAGENEIMRGRIAHLTPHNACLLSALSYKGKSMPMCSLLWQKSGPWGMRGWVRPEPCWVRDEDLRIVALANGDCDAIRTELYCVPAARLAAWRAVASRTKNHHGVSPPNPPTSEEP